MSVAFSSLIESHWRIFIILSFVIGFNPYNVYVVLYSALTYGDTAICPYLGYWIGAHVQFLIFFEFFYVLILYPVFYIWVVCEFLFSSWLCLYIIVCLRLLIASQLAMNELFSIMLHPKTIWSGLDCKILRYVLCNAKELADSISDQGLSSSR